MNNQKIERAYDFRGLFTYAFRNTIVVIIIVIIGIALGAGFSFASNQVVKTEKTVVSSNKQTVKDAKESLSDARVTEVESTYEMYRSLLKQKNHLKKIEKNSVFLNLDESTAKSNTIVYSIDGNSKLSSIAEGYKQMLKNDDLYSQIKKIKGLNVDQAYLQDLVSVRTTDMSVTVVEENTKSKFVTVSIQAGNDQQCKQLSKCVKVEMNEITTKLKKSFDTFNIHNSGDTYAPISSDAINNKRLDYDNTINALNQAITNSLANLSTDERTYFDVLVDTNAGVQTKAKVKKTVKYGNIIKFAILGAILLLFIYLIIMAIKYYFDNKIHTKNEFLKTFKIDVITDIKDNNNIDLNVAVEEISFLSKKNTNKKIGLLSTVENNPSMDAILKQLNANNVNCVKVSAAPSKKEEFDTLLKVDEVVLIEKLNQSNFHDVEKALRYYELKNINIVGAILIK